jgi:CheY-like chemotaxis protein
MKTRILYVDDEDDIREVAVFALELDPQLEVRSARSGMEALEVITSWRPDLILLDVMMPGMDGPEMLARMRAGPEPADLPVVFITARTQAHEVERFLALGAAGVIAKPFDPMTLAATARGHLKG